MVLEIVLALVLAVGALWLVLYPLFRPDSIAPDVFEPLDPSETRQGVAVAALREIEFDRATGKLSDADYHELHARYSTEAIQAMRDDSAGPATDDDAIEAMVAAEVEALESGGDGTPPTCPTCGPRPEADAVFCSQCGQLLPHPAKCAECGAPLEPGGRFCGRCGVAVMALS
jgi:hypothetical protein